jgi:hypothetical protein
MDIRDLNIEELDAQINLFSNRIETMRNMIAFSDEPERSAMEGILYQYQGTLRALQQEKSNRNATPCQTSFKSFSDFVFASSDHIRYENGQHVAGPHGGAGRAIKVEPNKNEAGSVLVTMYNLDGNHPLWQNNVQMAPKQMKAIEDTTDKLVLRGYGHDMMGSPFADYGLTVLKENGRLNKCILHMHDRNVDIEYLP